MTHAEKLKQLIDSKGIKYKFVAQKARINYITLIKYLNGQQDIPEHKLLLLCLVLNEDPKIFGLDDNYSCQIQAS